VWDPVTNKTTAQLVAETQHDMFCPGITMMPNGDIIVTGGQNANKTSIYHLASGTWNPAADMYISRGYGSSCLLSDGKVCTAALNAHFTA
jgi:galactose oxidase